MKIIPQKSTTDISKITSSSTTPKKAKQQKSITKVKKTKSKPKSKPIETIQANVFEPKDVDEWKQHLDIKGYVVIQLVPIATHDDWMLVLQELHDEFNPNDRSNWTNKILPENFSKAIQAQHHLCQSKLAWKIRTDSQIQHIFSVVHDCAPEDLCVSMDALSISWSKKNKSKLWPHDDQVKGIEDGDKYSIQGAYNTLSVGFENRGLCVVEKSHMKWDNRMEELKELKRLPKHHFSADEEFYTRCIPKLKKLLIPEHCLTLWNSRTVHCNSNDLIDRQDKDGNPQMNRLTSFVTWMPKAWRTQKVLEEKINAYEKGKGTSHWSNRCRVKSAPRWPRKGAILNNVEKEPFENIKDYL